MECEIIKLATVCDNKKYTYEGKIIRGNDEQKIRIENCPSASDALIAIEQLYYPSRKFITRIDLIGNEIIGVDNPFNQR